MTEATTDLADAGVADEEEFEEVVVLAGVHVGVVESIRGWGLGDWRWTQDEVRCKGKEG